ncbi:MAG: hypothetical protein U0105_08195 [Candidatus Obscuribacterales bacterium]
MNMASARATLVNQHQIPAQAAGRAPVPPTLIAMVAFAAAALAVSSLGLLVDPRLIDVQHAWLHAFKFSASLCIFGITMAWMSTFIERTRKWLPLCAVSALTGTVCELTTLSLQACRGASCAVNFSTPLDSAMWIFATISILPVAFATLVIFVLLMREPDLPPVLGLSLKLGVLLTLLGMAPGVVMLLPQLWKACHMLAPDVAASLNQVAPMMQHIDSSGVKDKLRAVHFIGLHAFQLVPTVGFVLTRIPTYSLSERGRCTLVLTAAIAVFDLMLLLVCEALYF